MTWKDLKGKIAKLSEEQLEGEVCFRLNDDNLMSLNFYIHGDHGEARPLEDEEWGTKVDIGMPKLEL